MIGTETGRGKDGRRARRAGVLVAAVAAAGGVAAPAAADYANAEWRGTMTVSISNTWQSGDHRLTDGEHLSFFSDGEISSAAITATVTDDVPAPPCGRAHSAQTGTLPYSATGGPQPLDAHRNQISGIAVDGPHADGSYAVTSPGLWLATKTVSTTPYLTREGTCATDVNHSNSDWFLGGVQVVRPAGVTPYGAISLRGTANGVDTNWIGEPQPVGVAHWNLSCGDVSVGPDQHVIRQGGIVYHIGACRHVTGRYIEVTAPEAVTVVKGSLPKAVRDSVRADRMVERTARFTARTKARLEKVFRHRKRIRISVRVYLWGDKGAPAVIDRSFVARR